MFLILIIGLIVFFIFYIIKNKVHLKIKTFFKRGFKKTDNKFRCRVFHG